jgi:hypothetical protein
VSASLSKRDDVVYGWRIGHRGLPIPTNPHLRRLSFIAAELAGAVEDPVQLLMADALILP